VIEARELFDADLEQIEVVVHPQSVIHGMVEFSDGSTIAQLSMPDMRLPIEYALGYPERGSIPFGRIDWSALGRLDFEPPDLEAFPCLGLAYAAGRAGETAPACLNAANEVAVEAFLAGRIPFTGIAETIESVLGESRTEPLLTLDQVYAVDIESRALAQRFASRLAPRASSLQP
jgi:1-deoxy-D-xylulose-5-phosphate reductoisomerase